MGKQAQSSSFQAGDYNEPTEPLELSLPPFGVASPVDKTLPATAQPGFRAFPPAGWSAEPGQSSSPVVYPVLPPAPLKDYRGRPPGGASPAGGSETARRRRSPLPGLVRMCFLLVQLVLLVRVVCLLFAVQNTMLWLTLLFAASDLFVLPVRWLAASFPVLVLAGTPLLVYLEYLVAILAYGLLARLLAFLLRRVLN